MDNSTRGSSLTTILQDPPQDFRMFLAVSQKNLKKLLRGWLQCPRFFQDSSRFSKLFQLYRDISKIIWWFSSLLNILSRLVLCLVEHYSTTTSSMRLKDHPTTVHPSRCCSESLDRYHAKASHSTWVILVDCSGIAVLHTHTSSRILPDAN